MSHIIFDIENLLSIRGIWTCLDDDECQEWFDNLKLSVNRYLSNVVEDYFSEKSLSNKQYYLAVIQEIFDNPCMKDEFDNDLTVQVMKLLGREKEIEYDEDCNFDSSYQERLSDFRS